MRNIISQDLPLINLQELKPQNRPFNTQVLLGCPEQSLLTNFSAEYFVGILAADHHFEQSLILINKLHTAANYERNVCIAELSETIGAFL